METLLRSLVFMALLYVAYHQTDKTSFQNPWSPGIEEALSGAVFSRLYMDGPRPFFIQRSHPDAKIFYDLNPRFETEVDLQKLCEIQTCFAPEVWVFSDRLKSQGTLEKLEERFGTITHRRKSFFIAKDPKFSCRNSVPHCEALRMHK